MAFCLVREQQACCEMIHSLLNNVPCIYGIVQLLKNVAYQQWKGKLNDMTGDITLGHIHHFFLSGCHQVVVMEGGMFGRNDCLHSQYSILVTLC